VGTVPRRTEIVQLTKKQKQGMQEFAFRGHDERESSINKGNYKEVAEVITRYDALLAEHIKLSTVFSGMSKTIQKDLISFHRIIH
jgi:hypothetical protein